MHITNIYAEATQLMPAEWHWNKIPKKLKIKKKFTKHTMEKNQYWKSNRITVMEANNNLLIVVHTSHDKGISKETKVPRW